MAKPQVALFYLATCILCNVKFAIGNKSLITVSDDKTRAIKRMDLLKDHCGTIILYPPNYLTNELVT